MSCISGFWAIGFYVHLSKNSSGSFLGNVRDTVNKVDTSFSLMWFTFILFYSDLLIFMDINKYIYIYFTWAKWPIQWTVLNSLNIGKSFQNIWRLYKSSAHNFNMSHITTGTAALWVFSCKTRRCSQKTWCLTSWSSKMGNCKGIHWLVFGKVCCIQRC